MDERLVAAREIREVVQRYLHTSIDDARSRLPSDWAPLLPSEVGEVAADSDGHVRLGAWRLDVQGDRAKLDYYPPGAMQPRNRFWFRIELTREEGRWEIVGPRVSFVHSWTRER